MKGILLVNTGSPTTCCRADVKEFVGSMLSDPKVMNVPDWFRPILVKGIILPLRQFSSTAHYSQIWDREHDVSPLLYHALQLSEKLEEKTELPVEVAMRYCKPDVTTALKRLSERNDKLHEVIVFPLFPQYAESSYKTVVDEVGRCFFQQPYPFRLQIIEPYFNQIGYIKALADSIRPHLAEDFDNIIFSFHSLPLDHVETGWKKGKEFDYVYQTKETIRLLQKELQLDVKKVKLTYHSAMGSKWLCPDLEDTLKELAEDGDRKVIVACPGFAADNLETLYDIDIKAREHFMKHGGEKLDFVPCLNSNDSWVDGIIKIISK